MAATSVAAAEAQELHLHFERGLSEFTSQHLSFEGPPAGDALTIDCGVARRGKCSQRALVRPGVQYVSHGRTRSEAGANLATALIYRPGEVWAYRFSIRSDNARGQSHADLVTILWQFKRTSSQPDAFIGLRDGKLILRVVKDAQVVLMDSMPDRTWLDFSVRAQWSTGQDGELSVTVRRADTVVARGDYKGPTLRSTSGLGYLKWGLYKPGLPLDADPEYEEIVWHDEIFAKRLRP